MKKGILLSLVIVYTLLLQGCLAVAVGTGALAAKAVSDPRSLGKQVDDTTVHSRIGIALDNNRLTFVGARIVATVYQGTVLLIGQAKSQSQVDKAHKIALSIVGVKEVYNQIRLAPRIGAATLANDAWITAKVKSQLIANSDIKARNIKVVTENSEVFLMGILTRSEAKLAAQIAGKVAGVPVVIKVFDYLD